MMMARSRRKPSVISNFAMTNSGPRAPCPIICDAGAPCPSAITDEVSAPLSQASYKLMRPDQGIAVSTARCS